ncbi:MAG: hypothetical protein NTV84_00580, partial [Methanoregula sp.]|nr:hypothetical protein [Methanoregula sp.]
FWMHRAGRRNIRTRNPSASCHTRSEGAGVWCGSFLRHQGCAVEGVPGVAGRDQATFVIGD